MSLIKPRIFAQLSVSPRHCCRLGMVFMCVFSGRVSLYSEVRIVPNDAMLAIGAMSEPLSLEALIRAAFLASGADDNEFDNNVERVLEIIDSLAPLASLDIASRGEAVLEWMHENLLTRYMELQTSLRVLLEKGTYNCVSSAVLYMLLARGIGIPVYGVLTEDHAFCHIPAVGESDGIDVETTTKHGFDAGSRELARDSFTNRTGFVYVPVGKQRKNIGEKELISLIYRNRISVLQRYGGWDEAVGLSLDKWVLTKSQAAMKDYQLSIRNYAIYLNEKKRHVEGLLFLNDAAKTLGKNHGLEDIASTLLGNAVVFNLRDNHIEEARGVLENENLRILVPLDFLAARRVDIMRRELEVAVLGVRDEASFRAALADLDEALASDIIDAKRWEELSLSLWAGEARRKSVGGDWMAGWLLLKDAPRSTRVIPEWDELEANYEYNAVITYHNRFAAAMRQRSIDAASEILDEGLRQFPNSPILTADKKLLSEHP